MGRTLFKALLSSLRKSSADRLLGLGLLIGMILLRIWDPAPLELLRLKTFDVYQILVTPQKAKTHTVVIVDIDEASLNSIGQWPWPRNIVAGLITKITNNGAVAIGLDIVFSEPDRMSPANFARSIKTLDDSTKKKLSALPGNDQVLATAMARSRVVLGQAAYHKKIVKTRARKVEQVPIATIGQDPRKFLDTFPDLIRNIPSLEKVAKGRGMFTIVPELDGVIRRIPVLLKVGDQIWPSLSFELLRVATGSSTLLVKSDDVGVISVAVARKRLKTDGKARVWFHFTKHDPSRYVSAKDVLNGKAGPKEFSGKLVLIGTSATGLFDIKATPVDPAMPGVEVHAQLLENVINGKLLSRPNYAIGAELILTVLLGLLIIILVPMLGAATTLLTGGISSGFIVWGSAYLFTNEGLVFDVVFPMLSSMLIFGSLVFLSYFREERQRREIRNAFGQYLSPDLVEQLVKNPEKLRLGGEKKEISVMFSDVRGFTTIAEMYKDDPLGLTTLINGLLTPLSNVIIHLKGTIDKYMGDNIMAFWNAPLDDRDHAIHACQAALDMLESLEELNEVRRIKDKEDGRTHLPLYIGVGINTGECVVGNIGSDMRFDYSLLGDSVNLAARLEGQTKTYGVYTILGEETAKQAMNDFAIVNLDLIQVVGKTEPERIYALIGDKTVRESQKFLKLQKLHEEMMSDYLQQRWKQALRNLHDLKEMAGDYNLAGFYDLFEIRIITFQNSPPGKNWDGVFIASTK